MTERIDHAAEAKNYLGAAIIDTYGDDDRKVAIAQVHALLALVEQQHIANMQTERRQLRARAIGRTDAGKMLADAIVLDDQISRALGLP